MEVSRDRECFGQMAGKCFNTAGKERQDNQGYMALAGLETPFRLARMASSCQATCRSEDESRACHRVVDQSSKISSSCHVGYFAQARKAAPCQVHFHLRRICLNSATHSAVAQDDHQKKVLTRNSIVHEKMVQASYGCQKRPAAVTSQGKSQNESTAEEFFDKVD